MSLFRGKNRAPQSPALHENESPPITAPVASSWSGIPSSFNAHHVQPISHTLDADDADDEDILDDESESELDPYDFSKESRSRPDRDDFDESELELDSGSDTSRPNGFTGERTTSQGYIAADDTQIAESLDQIESGDLAAHLYNAQALRLRARLPADQLVGLGNWLNKDFWLKEVAELQYTDVSGNLEFETVPPNDWTAWPLDAAIVPAPDEIFGRQRSEKEGEEWVIRGLGEQHAGDELREEMLAVMLRLAKEKYKSRLDESWIEAEDAWEGRSISRSRSRSNTRLNTARSRRSPSSKTRPDDAGSDTEMEESDGSGVDDDLATGSDADIKSEHLTDESHNSISEVPATRAIILADDDKARQILQPTINSLLGQLDRVAAAICTTRLNHYSTSNTSASEEEFDTCSTSGSERESDTGSASASSRSQSRTRSRSLVSSTPKSRALSREASVPKIHQSPESEINPRKRPLQQLIDSDSASDYGAEFEAKNELQSEDSDEPPPKRQRSQSRGSGDSESSQEDSVPNGLLDWSEVLGVASMVGWNERAIARTAQRCAELFGEGMAFRSFEEALAMKPIPEPVHYNPTTISAPNSLDPQSSTAEKRPLFQKGMLNCPHVGCSQHKEELDYPYRLIQHVQIHHGYDPRTNDSDNEEGRKHGGVHTDGFLLRIPAQQWWQVSDQDDSAAEEGQEINGESDSEPSI